jgi:hypothetical protein
VIRKALIGSAVTTLVVLLARSIAYATEPTSAARLLEQRAGGPAFPILTLTCLTLGAASAIAVCWLTAMAVRERALIERRLAERFAVLRTLIVACALTLATCVVSGLLEACIHWRAGLGWHGLHCLVGPVHRDLIPIEAGLSFVTAAILAAARHVAAWMRRTFARLGAAVPRLWFDVIAFMPARDRSRAALRVGSRSARAPPAFG